MKKLLKSMSLCLTLLLIFQLLIPFYALAEGASEPSLTFTDGNYTVSSVADLNMLRRDIDQGINYSGKTIILTQDIDLSQNPSPLNSFTTQNIFSGCFDGKSHTISGYTDAKSGLFSLIDSGGYVRNLRIEANVVINDESAIINSIYYNPSASRKNYGLIANECWGLINRCSTTGTVTTNITCNVGGIAGYNKLTMKVDSVSTTLQGKITNSFSDVIFNNQADSLVYFAGITMCTGDIIKNCYFYGKFIGNTLDKSHKQPIRVSGTSATTCAYNNEVMGFYQQGTIPGVKYTTAQMKDQAKYATLGFDFANCWSINPDINGGYPYLDPSKEDTIDSAVYGVNAQIAALPATITLVAQSSILAARSAYDALSETQKTLVTNLDKLTAAEATLVQLQAAADVVNAQIAALPATITLEDQNSVQAARTAYNALSGAQKALVTNLDKLTTAEATLTQLQAAVADQAAADIVITQIADLPAGITMEDQSSVQAARAAYDALSETQKVLVTNPNLNKLEAAEATLAELQEVVDRAAADTVITQIADLPAEITMADQSSVQAARAAYSALSEAQKLLVTNLEKLTTAEATLAGLQPKDTTPPVITIQDSADQTLSEDLTVTEPSFSFKVTAQDEKDGPISPSVRLNGAALTAGSNGTYTCTLTTGSNTISIIATDAAENKAEKSLSVTLGTPGTLTPSLIKNSEGKYTVSSAADLNTLRSDIDKGLDYYGNVIVLTQNIDLSQAEAPLNSFTTQNTFNGCFDGSSHTISGYADAKSGLFSLIDYSGYVKNLRLEAVVTISDAAAIIEDVGGNKYYGLIANESAGTISRCSTTGTVTTNVSCNLAGIVGYGQLTKKVDGVNLTTQGKIVNCFSNVVFSNQAAATGSQPGLCGISYWPGDVIEHCYFYGQFTGNTLDNSLKQPIIKQGDNASTCAYDYSVLGFYQYGTSYGVKYTTDQMKTPASYTALGFDFTKCWSIDSAINNGYPYLDPLKEDKVATVKVRVDIQVTVADKTYNASLSEAENLKAVVTKVQIANPTPGIAAAIANYNVKLNYEVKSATLSSRMGEWPVTVAFNKLDLTYDPNDAYEFTINRVLPTKAKYLENGQAGPTETEQAKQIALAKQAQDILYNSLQAGQGNVPAFTWVGDKATAPGKEGTILFYNDPWGIFSPARSGYTGVRSGYYDDWFQSVQTGLQTMKDAGIGDQDVKMTEWEKLVLAISAIGYDPRDIKAYDLINIISNKTYQAASHQIMSKPYAGFALNSYNYPTSADGNRFDIDAYIYQLAAEQIANLPTDPNASVDASTYDLAVMQLQPLFAYYNPNAKEGDPYYDVKVAVEYRLGIFSKAQTDLGYFYSGSYLDSNPWNNAQVYIALGMAKVNPFDARYIKNGYSMFEGAFVPYNFEKGTCSYKNDGATYEPGQMGRGLASLVRAYEGRNNIFDCSDVVNSTVLVNKAIAALPETITSANKAEVEVAQVLYDALSDAQEVSLQDATKAKLVAAQLVIGSEVDQAAAVVTAQIATLPVIINLADQSNIQAARAAYTALSEPQRALVTNLAKLTAAEVTLAQLQGGGAPPASLLTPPVLSADSTDNTLGKAVDLTFSDDPAWRSVISGITIDGAVLSPSLYTLTAGNFQLLVSAMTTAGSHTIVVKAAGYSDATVSQSLEPATTNLGTVKVRVVDNVQRLANEAASLEANYREPFGEILPSTNVVITEGLTMRGALQKALATKNMTVSGASNYVSGIGPVTSADGTRSVARLSEFDGGANSGWMVTLNDWFINAGVNSFVVKDGDVVEFCYTCNRGADVDGDFNNTNTSLKTLASSEGTLSPQFAPATKNYTLALAAATKIIITPTAANKTNQVIIQSGGNTYRRTDEIPVVDKQVITVTCAENTYKITLAIAENNQDQAQVDNVNTLIAALPDLAVIKLTDKAQIEAARAAYTALSEVQKSLVSNLAKLTAAEERIGQLLVEDTTSPIITIINLADQILNEDLTVTEPSFSFKVTALDEKEGLLSPSVKLNGTSLEVGTDGTYTCTLSLGSNIIDVTAADTKGNKAEKSLRVEYDRVKLAKEVAEGINSVSAPTVEATSLTMPTVPKGFTIAIKTSSNEEVIATDGTITPPENETKVNLVFTVTKTSDGSTADTKSLSVIVPEGIMVTDIAANIKAVSVPVVGARSLTMPSVPAGFTVALKSSSNSGVIATDGTITPPEKATKVTLVFTVTKTSDGSTADTKSLSVTVPEEIMVRDIAAKIKAVSVPAADARSLTMPSVPAGFTVALKSSNNPDVIETDGTITAPERATKVTLIFTVTKTSDGSTADTKGISVTVPEGIMVTDIAAKIKSVSVPDVEATSLTMPSVPAGFTVVLKSSSNPDVIVTDGTITPPEKATKVMLVFTVTKITNGTTADTKSIRVTVPKRIHASDIATGIRSMKALKAGATSLTMPSVPEGFTVALKSSSNPDVLATDGMITPPEKATKVTLVFTVTKITDSTTADTKSISVTVPKRILASDVATGIRSMKAPAAGATSLTMPSVPEGFSVALKSSNNPGVIETDGTIAPSEKATKVTLVFTVTKTADGTTADTKSIRVTVPKKKTSVSKFSSILNVSSQPIPVQLV